MQTSYFAFGSNLSSARLLERIPRAAKHCVATLPRHRLCWHKKGQDLSGKCDIDFTGDPGDIVYGVVYLMTQDDKLELDVYEGAGIGYERRDIRVTALHGEVIDVFTYFALEIDRRRQPYHWYKEHVLRGALEHEFPSHYVEHIERTQSIDDHDETRHHRELSIYLDGR
jgi:hypothetical protein